MSRAASFIEGFAGGIQRQRDNAMRREELDVMRSGSSGEPRGTSFVPPSTGVAKPFETGDPVADLAPHQKAFLNATAGGESGGRYNVRYTPQGGATFDGFDQHPGIFEEGPHGPSSAAGRYQFTKSTWNEMGGGRFDEASQDTRAWALAEKRYAAKTGRNLDSDLQSSGLTRDMMGALTPTWQAFGKNQDRHIATYNDSLRRYGAGSAPQAGSAPSQKAQGINVFGIKATPENPLMTQAWSKLRGMTAKGA